MTQNQQRSCRIQVVCTGGDPSKLHRIAIYLYTAIPSIQSGMLQNFLREDIYELVSINLKWGTL